MEVQSEPFLLFLPGEPGGRVSTLFSEPRASGERVEERKGSLRGSESLVSYYKQGCMGQGSTLSQPKDTIIFSSLESGGRRQGGASPWVEGTDGLAKGIPE
jgi:hypothetical protein